MEEGTKIGTIYEYIWSTEQIIFGDMKNDFFYLVENEKIVIKCFSPEIRKIIEDETMNARWFELPTLWYGVRTATYVAI